MKGSLCLVLPMTSIPSSESKILYSTFCAGSCIGPVEVDLEDPGPEEVRGTFIGYFKLFED